MTTATFPTISNISYNGAGERYTVATIEPSKLGRIEYVVFETLSFGIHSAEVLIHWTEAYHYWLNAGGKARLMGVKIAGSGVIAFASWRASTRNIDAGPEGFTSWWVSVGASEVKAITYRVVAAAEISGWYDAQNEQRRAMPLS